VSTTAVGSGTAKKEDGQAMLAEWRAALGSEKPQKLTREQARIILASIGIGSG